MDFHGVPQPELRDECRKLRIQQLPGREDEMAIFRDETDEDWDDIETTVPEILADSKYLEY